MCDKVRGGGMVLDGDGDGGGGGGAAFRTGIRADR